MEQASRITSDKCVRPATSQHPLVTTFVKEVTGKPAGTINMIGVSPLRSRDDFGAWLRLKTLSTIPLSINNRTYFPLSDHISSKSIISSFAMNKPTDLPKAPSNKDMYNQYVSSVKVILQRNDFILMKAFRMNMNSVPYKKLNLTLWEIMTDVKCISPKMEDDYFLYEQFAERETWLRCQLDSVLSSVIVTSSFRTDARSVELWTEFQAAFSNVTVADVIKGTNVLYSGQVPPGFNGTPAKMVQTLKNEWQRHNELARVFFKKTETNVEMIIDKCEADLTDDHVDKVVVKTEEFNLMTELNFCLQVIRIFQNLGLLKNYVVNKRDFTQVKVHGIIAKYVTNGDFQRALEAGKSVPTAAVSQQGSNKKRKSVGSGSRYPTAPSAGNCFYCFSKEHQCYKKTEGGEREYLCPRKIRDLKNHVKRRSVKDSEGQSSAAFTGAVMSSTVPRPLVDRRTFKKDARRTVKEPVLLEAGKTVPKEGTISQYLKNDFDILRDFSDDVNDLDPALSEALSQGIDPGFELTSGLCFSNMAIEEKAPAKSVSTQNTPKEIYCAATSNTDHSDICIVDSGSGRHICIWRDAFTSRVNGVTVNFVYPNGSRGRSSFTGNCRYDIKINTERSISISLNDVCFTPEGCFNIMSEHKLQTVDGYKITNSRDGTKKYISKGNVFFTAHATEQGVYVVDLLKPEGSITAALIAAPRKPRMIFSCMQQKEEALKELHLIFGHISKEAIIDIFRKESVTGLPNIDPKDLQDVELNCNLCMQLKMRRMSYKRLVGSRPDRPLQVIHTDIVQFDDIGFYNANFGYKYGLTFIDDCTSYKWTYVLKKKSETFGCFRALHKFLKNYFPQYSVCIIRPDGATDYFNKQFEAYCTSEGIKHESSNRYCPEENGASERHNGVMKAYVRTVLATTGFEPYWWCEVYMFMSKTDNKTPVRRLNGVTPHEVLFKTKPDVNFLRIWGSLCFAFKPHELRPHEALADRAFKCRFIGYSEQFKGYKLWSLKDGKIIHSRDVKFHKGHVRELVKAAYSVEPLTLRALQDTVKKPSGIPRQIDEVSREIIQSDKNPGDFDIPECTSRKSNPDDTDSDQMITTNDPTRVISPTMLSRDESHSVAQRAHAEMDTSARNTEQTENASNSHSMRIPQGNGRLKRQVHEMSSPEGQEKPNHSTDEMNIGLAEEPIQRKSKRNPKSNPKYSSVDYVLAAISADEEKKHVKIKEPRTMREVLHSEQKSQWIKSSENEIDGLWKKGAFKLVKLPPGKKAYPSKWIFKVKYHQDHSIEKFKSRICYLGNLQKYGEDYFTDPYSPVGRIETFRLILAISAILDLHIHQIDITQAFIHADLDEEVYMKQPEGFVAKGKEDWVLRVLKAIYGLRQAPRAFYSCLHRYLVEKLGFKRTMKDYCLYVRREEDGTTTFIIVYVDDLTLACSDLEVLEKIKKKLSIRFELTDGGEIDYMLKMQITRNRAKKTISVTQTKYIEDLVERFSVQDMEGVETPTITTLKLEPETVLTPEEVQKQPYPYRSLIGSLVHLVKCTRPEIANIVRVLSRYLTCFNGTHYQAGIRVLRYLKHTKNYGLVFNGTNSEISYDVYSDAAFGNKDENRISVTGYALRIANAVIAYKSCIQKNITLNTAEAETVAHSEAARESQWLSQLFSEIGITPKQPIDFYCDNTATIQLIKNPINHPKNKHIEIRHLYTRGLQEEGHINIQFVRSENMIADILTKNLPKGQFQRLRSELGVKLVQ